MEKDFLNSLGERVRSFRKMRGYSQLELAEKADLHTTYVSDIERGTARKVSAESVYKISQALDIQMADLFSNPDGDSEIDSLTAQCFADLRSRPREKRLFVLNTIKQMLGDIDTV